MDDEEDLQSWACPRSSQTCATWIRAACCHSGLGTEAALRPFRPVCGKWMARAASLTGQFERFVRGDGWCFDLGLSQVADRWLVRGARERAFGLAPCGTLWPRTQDGNAHRLVEVDTCTRACLDNDNDTVVLIVTGAVEFVTSPLTNRVHSQRSKFFNLWMRAIFSGTSLQCQCRVVEMSKGTSDLSSKNPAHFARSRREREVQPRSGRPLQFP